MSIYKDAESKKAPPWLRGANGKKILEETGAEKDVQVDRARQSVLADFPDQGPADAVPFIGSDRALPQGVNLAGAITETTTPDYRERLRTAWDSIEGWSFAGSFPAVLRALARGGFPTGLASGAILIQRTKRYAYLTGNSASGTVTFGTHVGWSWDEKPARYWNQFGILFPADVSGLTDGSDLAARLNGIVRTWKPGKARFMGTTIILSGAIWGWPLAATWGGGGRTWGGSTRFVSPG